MWRKFVHGEFLTAVVITVVGLVAIALATDYGIGSLGDIGPGYFPIAVGLILSALGVVIAGLSLYGAVKKYSEKKCKPLPLILFVCAVVLWMLSIEKVGIVLATVLLTVVARIAMGSTDAKSIILHSAILALIGVIIFKAGFHIPLPVWPDF